MLVYRGRAVAQSTRAKSKRKKEGKIRTQVTLHTLGPQEVRTSHGMCEPACL